MLELLKIDIQEFKETIYPKYLKLFPVSERKSYKQFVSSFNKGILNIIKITLDGKCIGFFLANSIKESRYLQVDYFAIFPKFQGKGYGSQAINKLKQMSGQYKGIFIEVEKLGLGSDSAENALRQRRMDFYINLGFTPLNYDFNLFKVIFTPLVLAVHSKIDSEEKIVQEITKIYYEVLGEKVFNNNCIIKRT